MTELILMTDVKGLGAEGAVVKVADGYARNYLIPRKKGMPVSRAALKRLEKKRADRQTEGKKEVEKARALAEAIEKISCTIPGKVIENDRLFGSVTNIDISTALKEQGIELDRHMIQLEEPIRELGIYTIKIKLHDQVETSLKLWVVGE